MTAALQIRWACRDDFDVLGEVMFDAVRTGESPYGEAQRAAWVPAPRSGAEWNARLAGQDVILGDAGTRILGFMSLADGGYIDFAFIRPSARRTGLFRTLFDSIAERARSRAVERLWVHASLMAEPAFAAMGFRVTCRETVRMGGECLDRCEMEKMLS
jgi:putative acetyltransferase